MRLFGYELNVTRAARTAAAIAPAGLSPRALWGGGGVVREPYTGAWQRNDAIAAPSLLASPAVFTCVSRISQDVAKVRVNLVQETAADIWEGTSNPAYSPVLRKPNHYQTMRQLLEQWVQSKLTAGNTYLLKRRDRRGVVDAVYVLNPACVTPLVGDDGSVYYELRKHGADVSGAWPVDSRDAVIVPAREIVHDRWNCFHHPLVGLPPLYAAALAAQQGLTMQTHATEFFSAGTQPNGVLMAPVNTSKDTLKRLQDDWAARTNGIAVLSGELKYEQLSISSVDSQFVEQLHWTTQQIANVFGYPLVLLNGDSAAYGKNEAIVQMYHDTCLQPLMKGIEDGWDEALEFQPGSGLGVELDVDDLIWMDTATRTAAAAEGVKSGVLTPNEARRKYFALPPVAGGESVYLQQQMFSLEALAARDAAAPAPATVPMGPPA